MLNFQKCTNAKVASLLQISVDLMADIFAGGQARSWSNTAKHKFGIESFFFFFPTHYKQEEETEEDIAYSTTPLSFYYECDDIHFTRNFYTALLVGDSVHSYSK